MTILTVPFIGNAPVRQHVEDAGADLIITDEATIAPGEHVIVHTGTRLSIPAGYVGMVYVRSSIGFKRHLCLSNGTGVIDAGFQGEIKLSLHNAGTETQTLEEGERVAQVLFQKVIPVVFNEVESFNITDRGNEGFGSTGKH